VVQIYKEDLEVYLSVLGHKPVGSYIVGFEGLVVAFEQKGREVIDYGGKLGARWTNKQIPVVLDSVIKLPSENQTIGNIDDLIIIVDDSPELALSTGKVNADRASMVSRGSAQISYGPTKYVLSDSPSLGPDILRPRPGDAVNYYDVNMDRKVTLEEVAGGSVRYNNRTILGHAMGLSEGCWGPLGGRDGRAWRYLIDVAKKHLGSNDYIEVFILHGHDFWNWCAEGDENWIPFLHVGQRGPKVKEMQELLTKRGFELTCDGDFGPKTAKAVIKFRTNKGLDNLGWAERGFTKRDWGVLLGD
tara:strand:+ start:1190 stop:2095 length:906 start_codon:yes stop_codon:yes gene_type:complete